MVIFSYRYTLKQNPIALLTRTNYRAIVIEQFILLFAGNVIWPAASLQRKEREKEKQDEREKERKIEKR